jgi:signal transduction histidine kinase/ActR/RegA family two-component response regulator
MARVPADHVRDRVLVLAPFGRDAALARTVLERARLVCTTCPDVAELPRCLEEGAGVAVVAEEALTRGDTAPLVAWLADQPPWSDLPFVILTNGGDTHQRSAQVAQLADMLQNVTLLERPLQSVTLVSAVKSGIRARLRQYEVRDYLVERERIAEELSRLNQTLEQRVADRTRRLEESNRRLLSEIEERRRTEDALRQAQKMQAVGQLTGGIAHDFNNMLTVIGANLELLHDKLEGNGGLQRMAAAAIRSVDKAAKLTQQLLAFSRKQRLEPRPIKLNDSVAGLDDLLRRTVGEAIELRKELSAELWPALADPNQLESCLLNLAINARDAIEGSGVVTISTRNAVLDEDYATRHADVVPGRYVELAVTDTGSGMPPEVLARAFEPFFTTKEVGKGSGLGLSQVYGFVRQSNGHVRIDSRLGHGTTIRIYLPQAASQPAALDEPRAGDGNGRRRADGDTVKTILVVEDNEGVREVAVSVLEDSGYRVYAAADATMALEVLRRHDNIDLIFTDIVMPGEMNGIDLANVVRERWPSLRLVVTSGYAERLAAEGLRQDVAFLSKPYRPLDLVARVKSTLDGKSDQVSIH